MSSELRFCICGGTASISQYGRTDLWIYDIVCSICSFTITDTSPEEAVKRWNTRPIEDALQAQLAKANAIIEAQRGVIEAHDEYLTIADEIAEIRLSSLAPTAIPQSLHDSINAAYDKRDTARARLAQLENNTSASGVEE